MPCRKSGGSVSGDKEGCWKGQKRKREREREIERWIPSGVAATAQRQGRDFDSFHMYRAVYMFRGFLENYVFGATFYFMCIHSVRKTHTVHGE
jgi:hypothetical protein